MADENHVTELLPAYALGCLDEAETRLVAEHLEGCHICRMELRAFQEVTGQLALMVPEARPSPDLRSRLQERIQSLNSRRAGWTRRQATRPPLFGRLIPVSAVIGLAVITMLSISNLLLWQRLNHPDVLTGPLGMRAIALQNTAAAPQASGIVIISSDGENGVLVVDELSQLDAGHEYQLWLVRGDQNTSAAVFSVDETGYRGMRIEAPESLIVYSAVRITIEPAGGSPQPVGEEVLHGSLSNP